MDPVLEQTRQQVIDLFNALGLSADQRKEVIEALANHAAYKRQITRDQLVAMDLPELIPFLSALETEDLEQAFLSMFPGGRPSMIGDRINLEYYVRAAVANERRIKGLPVTK